MECSSKSKIKGEMKMLTQATEKGRKRINLEKEIVEYKLKADMLKQDIKNNNYDDKLKNALENDRKRCLEYVKELQREVDRLK
jgi:hypothetical protein